MKVFSVAGVIATAWIALQAQAAQPVAEPRRSVLYKDSRGDMALAKVRGKKNIDMLLAAIPGQASAVAREVERLGGKIHFRDEEIGYLRVTMPLNGVDALAAFELVQVSDVVSVESSKRPILQMDEWPPKISGYPLTHPYSPLADLDAAQWAKEFPTFDGRGVTIAIVEDAFDLLAPELQMATSLEGKPVRKVIDIRSTADPHDTTFGPRWVAMSEKVRAVGRVFQHAASAYRTPKEGVFRLGWFDERAGESPYLSWDVNFDGNPADSSGLFGVLWDERSHSVWVDTDQDRDFSNEREMQDYGVRPDVNVFGHDDPETPQRETSPFSVQIDTQRKQVAINVALAGRAEHATMVVGIALANAKSTPAARIDGLAPGAQLISIHSGYSLAGQIEGMIAAFRDARSDIVLLQPSTIYDSAYRLNDGRRVENLILRRLIDRYQKPFFLPGGNTPGLNQILTSGTDQAFSVGMYISQRNMLEIYGVATQDKDNLSSAGSFGPSGNGALEPTFVAPMTIVSLMPAFSPPGSVKGLFALPPGYGICGGTSCAAPLAAGAVARLISAAKQRGIRHDLKRLRQALVGGTRFLAGIDAHQQGNGLLQLNASWNLLQQLDRVDEADASIRIIGRAPINTALSPWLEIPGEGVGLYEREGWKPGDHAQRTVVLTRTSGPPGPAPFKVNWIGNEKGAFSGAEVVDLPLGKPVNYTVNISTATAGAYSALMGIGDAYRMMMTVVAADPLDEQNPSITKTAQLKRLGKHSFFFHVPDDVNALTIRLNTNGTMAQLIAPDRSAPGGWASTAILQTTRVIADPMPGVWEVLVLESVNLGERLSGPLNPIEVSITAAVMNVDVVTEPVSLDSQELRMTNRGATFVGGAVSSALGSGFKTQTSMRALEQRQYSIQVPPGSTRLDVRLKGSAQDDADLDLYLFNCAADSCEAVRSSTGAGGRESLSVDSPTPGRWEVVVDAADIRAGQARYDYRDVIFNPALGALSTTDSVALHKSGESWSATAHVWAKELPPDGRALYGQIGVVAPDMLTDPRSPQTFHYLDMSGVTRTPAVIGSAEFHGLGRSERLNGVQGR